jgi:para-aminobenzoate synthetase component 1
LITSEKDSAENVMIVDLMRSDLGRVCVPGSIAVPELFAIEEYPTVYQMVSTVTGRTRAGVGPVEVLEACFPGGSVTGAPKIRAMEIINEIEPVQRSIYCGAIGYIGFEGSMLMSIPIRNILVADERAYVQVGGGIVADSDPGAEYRESLDKAAGSLMALDAEIRELDL